VLTGLWDAAQHFRRLRLPELFCGLPRDQGRFPVHYPVACSPQAWSSAAWFLLLRAVLGLFPDAPNHELRVVQPWLPPWLDTVTLEGLRVGRARATIRFMRGPTAAFVEVLGIEGGELKVRIEV
jgi:glycogen debranching enzyme